jgi:hypothetical protein
MSDFLNFSKFLIRKKFPVLPADTQYSTEHWMDGKYTEKQKAEFRKLLEDPRVLTAKDLLNKSFLKDEAHDVPKNPRGINAYTDRAKVFCGAIQHQLDEAIYKLPWAVKHMDVSERPKMLKELFGESPVSGTDYTAMEAHHEGMRAKIRVYWKQWVGQLLPHMKTYLEIVKAKAYGVNECEFKGVKASLKGRLMSGDCSTSSDNLVLNICLTLYMLWKSVYNQLPLAEAVEKVCQWPFKAEGDDGIFKYFEIKKGLIEDMGLLFKKDDYPHFGMASFCGIVADPLELINVTNPLKVLADFSVLPRRYMAAGIAKVKQLMRAKAMSYLVCYSGCPIIDPFCRYVLRATRGIDVTGARAEMGWWQGRALDSALKAKVWQQERPIAQTTRSLVDVLYNISEQQQRTIEQRANELVDLAPIDVGTVEPPKAWVEYSVDYVDSFGWAPRPHPALSLPFLKVQKRSKLCVHFEPSHN